MADFFLNLAIQPSLNLPLRLDLVWLVVQILKIRNIFFDFRVKSCLVTLKDKFEKGPLQEIKSIKAVTQVSN